MRQKPNIIFIMADDMGYGDLRCYNPGSRIPTPNMDRLASMGTLLTDAHAPSAICTPSRYGVLTGRYCWRTRLKEGVTGGYDAPLIEKGRPTVASMLKQSGYNTACIGKWHVGLTFHDRSGNPTVKENEVDFRRPVADGPAELGFDYAYFNAGCGTCAPPYGFIENRHFVDKEFTFFNPGKGGPVAIGAFGQWGGMMGDSWVTKDADLILAEKACRYIEAQAGKDDPFFLYFTPNAPHEPCVERFVPEFARGKSKAGARGDLVWLFDWIVGRIMETLERRGLTDDTFVIVTSDNGALPGDFILDADGNRVMSGTGSAEYRYEGYSHKSNADWRGYKAHIWEGGHRAPFIACLPGTIPAGSTSDELICLTDFMATCAKIVGCEFPAHAAEDSVSILPALRGELSAGQKIRESVVHHSSFGVFSIRKGNWKLVLDCADSGGWPTPRGTHPQPNARGQLYNVFADPNESSNLWDERQDIVQDMKLLLKECQERHQSNVC